tara:strand:+ start:51 stop:776 length:726 start_codon:yes stop_codon:yes gene_type:complete
MPSYCAHADVSAFLQVSAFHATDTTPTISQVEAFIDMAEGRIEQLTNHAWSTAKAITVTDERVRVQTVRSTAINDRGRIQLSHYPIVTLAGGSGDTLKVWEGSAYVDYVASKTMGSSVTDVVDKDFWVDTERGIIYIENYAIHNMLNSAPAGVSAYVKYRYATASTPQDIKLATIYLTAATIAMNDDLNLMPEGEDSMDNSTKSQKFEDMAIKILKDNRRMDRDMKMARSIGGFGTGMVTP